MANSDNSQDFEDETRSTIYDVAVDAGVSVASVSRVMNDKSNVAWEIRRRVLDSIRKLQYRPNEAARALGRRSKSN